jgi:hypothetical protein
METVRQARAALTAAKYQNGVPFLVHNSGTFGVGRNYDVCDFRKRGSVIREREAQTGAGPGERGAAERRCQRAD